MDDILLTRALRDRGFGYDEVARLAQRGDLIRIRRGAYGTSPGDGGLEQEHRRLTMATVPQLALGATVSHGSAAVLHGLPVWPDAVARVHVTRSRSYGAKRRTVVEVHGAAVTPSEIIALGGTPVTALARTVLDLARTLPMEQAVAAGDRALALGLDRRSLELGLQAMDRWPGVRQARRVCAFLDRRSESVGESVSRVRFHEDGLPAPTLQLVIRSHRGSTVGRADFGWEDHRTLGEFDGRIKYGRCLEPGQSVEDVLFAEKRREDELRDLGWQVVRWVWSDLYRPGVIRDRLLRAFARAR